MLPCRVRRECVRKLCWDLLFVLYAIWRWRFCFSVVLARFNTLPIAYRVRRITLNAIQGRLRTDSNLTSGAPSSRRHLQCRPAYSIPLAGSQLRVSRLESVQCAARHATRALPSICVSDALVPAAV